MLTEELVEQRAESTGYVELVFLLDLYAARGFRVRGFLLLVVKPLSDICLRAFFVDPGRSNRYIHVTNTGAMRLPAESPSDNTQKRCVRESLPAARSVRITELLC